MKIDKNKIEKAIELQFRANREIDVYGKTSESTFNQMMEIIDSLNEDEQDLFVEWCNGKELDW